MKRLALILGAFLAAATAHAQLDRPSPLEEVGACSGLTCGLTLLDAPVQLQNGPYTFGFDTDKGSLVVLRGSQKLASISVNPSAITMTWSRDHRAFALTWTDGGSIGNFHVKTFHLQNGTFRQTAGADRAFRHFQKRHDCPTRGDNVQAYRFEDGGKNLMLILSVYPTGDCGLELGHTEGYLVRVVDGAILKCLGLHELNTYMREHPEGR